MKDKLVHPDPWSGLRKFTDARISLGRCGTSLPTTSRLELKLAHAKARDAVHLPMQVAEIQKSISTENLISIAIESQAQNRDEYLTRPDKGRLLSQESIDKLTGYEPVDICIVIADGLSSHAIHDNIPTLFPMLCRKIQRAGFSLGPICIAKNGRVALADHAASLMNAKITLMLIGERPGLSSPNSLGAYLTYNAHPGTTDEARNCVSNIRKGGLSSEEATQKICYLIEEAWNGEYSGVQLKDKMSANYLPFMDRKLL